MNRRTFVGKAALAGLGTFAFGKVSAVEKLDGREITVFTKFRKKLSFDELAAMNVEIVVQGLYQNHRDNNYVGGPIWDMVGMLEESDLKHLSLAFDFAHATVEGANAWEMNFHRALPHIGAIYYKDYRLDGKTWNPCPIGEGVVNAKSGKLAAKLPPEVPISIHIEYVKTGDVAKTVEAMKNDLATVRKWLG